MKVAFISSAVPSIYLKDQNEKIDLIILNGEKYLNAYIFVKKYLKEDYKIITLPENQKINAIFLAAIITIIKIFRFNIIIFHEACWPILDILVSIIKPNGTFVPMTSLNGFTKLNKNDSKNYIDKRIKIKIIGKYINKIFHIYSHRPDNGEALVYDWVMKLYPNNIIRKYDSYLLKRKKNSENKLNKKSILLIVGSDAVKSLELHFIYGKIIENLIVNKIHYRIKDHPLSHGRLNLKDQDENLYNPNIPADFLFEEHSIAIGCASTALCTFPGKKASIINLIKGWSSEDKSERYSYLQSLNKEIYFPQDMDELNDWIDKVNDNKTN